MGKTLKEWYEHFPNDIKKKALANTKNYKLIIEYESFEDGMWNAFSWSETPEGSRYWNDIASNLQKYDNPLKGIKKKLSL